MSFKDSALAFVNNPKFREAMPYVMVSMVVVAAIVILWLGK